MLGVSGLQVLPLPFYFLATIREPTLALHMLLPSRLLLLPRNYGAGVSQTGGREAKQVFPTLGCFSQIFCHSDETLPNMFFFPVHEDVCNQFYGSVCFPLHNLHPYLSCFSLSGFLPVSRS